MPSKENGNAETSEHLVQGLLDSFETDPDELIATYDNVTKQLTDQPEVVQKQLSYHSPNLVDSCLAHLKQSTNVVLQRKSTQLLAILLNLTDFQTNKDKAVQIMEDLIEMLKTSTDSTVIIRCLWCFTKQQFPEDIFKSKLAVVLQNLKTAREKKELQTSQLNGEFLTFILHCMDKYCESMNEYAVDWVPSVLKLCMDTTAKHSDKAVNILEKLCNYRQTNKILTPDIGSSFKNDVKSIIAPYLHQQLKRKEEVMGLKFWGVLIKLLGKTIHTGSSVLNSLLTVAETCFKSPDQNVRMATFSGWKILVTNFSMNLDVLSAPARLKLLVQPLIHVNAASEQLAAVKFDTWWTLCVGLQHKLEENFALVVVPMLRLMTGGAYSEIDVHAVNSTPKKNSQGFLNESFQSPATPSTPKLVHLKLADSPKGMSTKSLPVINSLQDKLGFVLSQLLGAKCQNSFDLEPLAIVPMKAQTLGHYGHVLVQCLRIWVCHCKSRDEYHATSLNIWDKLCQSIAGFAGEMDSEQKRLLLESVLLQFKAFAIEAPQIDAHCLIETCHGILAELVGVMEHVSFENTDISDTCPAQFLLSILMAKLAEATIDKKDSEKFCSILRLVTKSVFKIPQIRILDCLEGLVSSFGEACQNFEANVRLEFWESIRTQFSDWLENNNEVNQGSPTEHNFVCAFECLSYPILFCDALESVNDIKKFSKEWSDMFEQVTRCVSLASTTDSNTCASEFCSVLNRNVSLELTNVCTLLLTTEALQAMEGCINFDEAKNEHDDRMQNKRSPVRWCKTDGLQPLASLTPFVMLLKSCWNKWIEMKNEQKMEAYGVPILGNILTCASRLFDKVTWSSGQITLAEMLVPCIAATLQDAAHNNSKIKWNTRGVLGWLDACHGSMCKGLVKHYGGPYDDICLQKVSSMVIAGLTTSRVAVRSETLSFWQATFGQCSSNLQYPQDLRETLITVQGKLNLRTPGLESTSTSVEMDEATTDDITVPIHDANDEQFAFDVEDTGVLALKSDDDEAVEKDEKAMSNGVEKRKEDKPTPMKRKRVQQDEDSCLFVPPQDKKVMRMTEHQKEKLKDREEMPYLGPLESQTSVVAPPPDFTMDSQDTFLMAPTKEPAKKGRRGTAKKSVRASTPVTCSKLVDETKDADMNPIVLLERCDKPKVAVLDVNLDDSDDIPLAVIAKGDSEKDEMSDAPKASDDEPAPKRGRKSKTPKKAIVREAPKVNKPTPTTRSTRRVSSTCAQDMQITVTSSTVASAEHDVQLLDDVDVGNEFKSLHSDEQTDDAQQVQCVEDWSEVIMQQDDVAQNAEKEEAEKEKEETEIAEVEKPDEIEKPVEKEKEETEVEKEKPEEVEKPVEKEKDEAKENIQQEASQNLCAPVSTEVTSSPGGILKRRLSSANGPNSPLTPGATKHRHVHFAEEDGYVSDHVVDSMSPKSTPTLETRASDDAMTKPSTPKSKISQAFSRNFQRRTLQMVKKAAEASGSVVEEEEEAVETEVGADVDNYVPPSPQISVKDSAHPIFPALMHCDRPIKEIVPMISTAMKTGLLHVLSAKKLATIGDLASKSESYVMGLPVKHPKVKTVVDALNIIHDRIDKETASKATAVAEAVVEKAIAVENEGCDKEAEFMEEDFVIPIETSVSKVAQAEETGEKTEEKVVKNVQEEEVVGQGVKEKVTVVSEQNVESQEHQMQEKEAAVVTAVLAEEEQVAPAGKDSEERMEESGEEEQKVSVEDDLDKFEAALANVLNADVVDVDRLRSIYGRLNLCQTKIVDALFKEKTTF